MKTGGYFHEMAGKCQVSDCYHKHWVSSRLYPPRGGWTQLTSRPLIAYFVHSLTDLVLFLASVCHVELITEAKKRTRSVRLWAKYAIKGHRGQLCPPSSGTHLPTWGVAVMRCSSKSKWSSLRCLEVFKLSLYSINETLAQFTLIIQTRLCHMTAGGHNLKNIIIVEFTLIGKSLQLLTRCACYRMQTWPTVVLHWHIVEAPGLISAYVRL